MDLDEFLLGHEITVGGIVAEADAALKLARGDMLFFCGSLIDGWGNERSDVDMYFVTSRPDIPLNSFDAVTLIVGKAIVDIGVVQRSHVDDLVQRFKEWSAQPRHPRNSRALDENERRLLHRLQSGRVVYGADNFECLREQIDVRELARLRLDFARYSVAALQVDLAGLRSAGDSDSMLFVAKEVLGHTVDALLAAHGGANPSWKWRVQELAQLTSNWEADLPGRPSGMSARDFYLTLSRAPQSRAASVVYDYALRIVAFSRRVFPWAESRLATTVPLGLAATIGVDAAGVHPLPHLDVDVTIRYEQGRFELLRVNGSGQIFTLSANQYSVLALFDGEASAEGAAAQAERLWGVTRGSAVVNEMLSLVRHADFGARDMTDEETLSMILRQPAATTRNDSLRKIIRSSAADVVCDQARRNQRKT